MTRFQLVRIRLDHMDASRNTCFAAGIQDALTRRYVVRMLKLSGQPHGRTQVKRTNKNPIYSVYRKNIINILNSLCMFDLHDCVDLTIGFIKDFAYALAELVGRAVAHTTVAQRWVPDGPHQLLGLVTCINQGGDDSLGSRF